MSLFVESVNVFFQVLWLLLVALVKTIVPTRFHPKKNVKDQIVLVTGAGSGLGRLLSLSFSSLGARLVLWDIDENGNKKTAELIKAAGGQVATFTVDLSKRESIYQAADKVKSEIGDVDILVNNAGIVTGKKLLDCSDELMIKTMDVNCNAHFWTTKAFLPAMLSRNHGHIVSIASGAGLFGLSGLGDYCASKFGAVGFLESLRNELSKQRKTGIYTTLVCPYYINTGMFEGVKTRFPLILPILNPDEVVSRIIESVLTNKTTLLLPGVLNLFLYLKGLFPVAVNETLADFFGINDTMDEFIGRSKSK